MTTRATESKQNSSQQNNTVLPNTGKGISMPAVPVVLQKIEQEEIRQHKLEYPTLKENKTGMPDNLKTGIENLSGLDMSDVRVHYNSLQPAQFNSHAYAQGTDIHITSGQEKHLPHEAWHVVQQKQGRVSPTMQMKTGVAVNDDPSLENEADVMGDKVLHMKQSASTRVPFSKEPVLHPLTNTVTIQRQFNGESAAPDFRYLTPEYLVNNQQQLGITVPIHYVELFQFLERCDEVIYVQPDTTPSFAFQGNRLSIMNNTLEGASQQRNFTKFSLAMSQFAHEMQHAKDVLENPTDREILRTQHETKGEDYYIAVMTTELNAWATEACTLKTNHRQAPGADQNNLVEGWQTFDENTPTPENEIWRRIIGYTVKNSNGTTQESAPSAFLSKHQLVSLCNQKKQEVTLFEPVPVTELSVRRIQIDTESDSQNIETLKKERVTFEGRDDVYRIFKSTKGVIYRVHRNLITGGHDSTNPSLAHLQDLM